MKNQSVNKKSIIILSIFALVMSFICIGSSPLLDYMDPDSQNFWLIGRSMAAGQVAYRDIFDHKGPYIFFINEIAAWISSNSEIGLFFLECIENIVNIIIVYIIAGYYTKNEESAVLSAMAFLGVSFNFFTFVTGNLTDSWSVMFQLISILFIFKYAISGEEEHPPVYMYIHGLCATIVMMMRPNNAGMWIPFGIVLAIRLFSLKKLKNFFVNLGTLSAGVLTGFLPYIFYGLRHDCFDDMWYGMFTANFTYTSNNASWARFPFFLREFIFKPSIIVVILGIISTGIVIRCLNNIYLKVSFVSMFICSLIFMNVSLRSDGQYNQLYMVFIIPFCIASFNKFGKYLKQWIWITLIIIMVLLSNLQLIKQITKYGAFHYFYESAVDMRDRMLLDEDDKVLVLGCNSVFYNVTNTLPHIKYFITYGGGLDYSRFPDAVEMQRDSILSLENKYIMMSTRRDGSIYGIEDVDNSIKKCLEENYKIAYEKTDGIYAVMYEIK